MLKIVARNRRHLRTSQAMCLLNVFTLSMSVLIIKSAWDHPDTFGAAASALMLMLGLIAFIIALAGLIMSSVFWGQAKKKQKFHRTHYLFRSGTRAPW